MSIQFIRRPIKGSLLEREILGESISIFLDGELSHFAQVSRPQWEVTLGEDFVYNRDGLKLLMTALLAYEGVADIISFNLECSESAFRDYYSLQRQSSENIVRLNVVARRVSSSNTLTEAIELSLPEFKTTVPMPRSLAKETVSSLPLALLMNITCEHELLFANQIAHFPKLLRHLRTSPLAWMKSLLPMGGIPFKQRLALKTNNIHPSAQVHPTAVVEGSFVGEGTKIGAHAVVRYSHLGKFIRLHDGAKVEHSVIGDGCWLMHDLVFYRSCAEKEVFLIHGPYQFSYFQSFSAAFATIMMDYRPDARPIKISTNSGMKAYEGRFLGSVLKSGSKTLGGSNLAPGRIVPENIWLAGDRDSVHILDNPSLPQNQPIFPKSSEIKDCKL
jgi:hypothetical protein